MTAAEASAQGALRLHYSVEIGPGGLPYPKHRHSGLEERFGKPGPSEITVHLGKTRLAIDWHGEKRFSASCDLITDEALVIEHAAREYRRIRPVDRKRVAGGAPNKTEWRSERSKDHRKQQLGKFNLSLERFTIMGQLLCNLTVWRNTPSFPIATQKLWDLVLPFAEDGLRRAGLPYEIVLRSPEAPASSYVLVRLTALETTDPDNIPTDQPPEGYSEAKPVEIHRRLSGRKAESRPTTPLHAAAREMRRRHRLRAGGQDVAWTPRQTALDTVSEAVNSVSSVFDTFRGGGGRLNAIIIDWQRQLADHLDDDRRIALQLLNLYRRVYQGEPDRWVRQIVTSADHPLGLTPEEAEALESAPPSPNCAAQDLDDKACQVLTFHETIFNRETSLGRLGQSRIDEIAQAQWDQLEIVVDTRSEEIRQADDCIQFQAWDFDTEIIINGEPIIDSLTFRDDEIRLILHLDEIYTDFQWSSGPNPAGVCSMLCTFLTFGLCALLEMNYSPWSHLVVEDARIVIDFRPQIEDGRLRLHPNLNHDETDFDVDIFLVGVNLVQDVILLGVSAIGSWFEAFDDTLFRELQARLDELFNLPFLVWPNYWNAEDGPGISPTVALLSNSPAGGSFEASLIQTSGLPQAIAEDVDLDQMQDGAALAFVVSRRYLTAWLRRLADIQHVAATTDIPVGEIEAAADVTLPEPSELPGPDAPLEHEEPVRPPFPGCDTTPPGPAIEYFNRVVLTRSAPTVSLPEEGLRQTAGLVTVAYDFTVEAVRRDFVPTLHVVREPCIQDPGAFFEGFGRFVGFPEPFIPPEWLRGEPVVMGAQPETQPGGTTELRHPIPGRSLEIPGGAARDMPAASVPRFGAGSLPGEGASEAGGLFPCPPPFCEWTFPARDTTLLTYVSAQVVVTANLLMGFSGREFWLPELTLTVPTDSFAVEIDALNAEEPFSGDARRNLENYLLDKVRTDLEAYFELVVGDPPDTRHQAVPQPVATFLNLQNGIPLEVTEEIANFLVFRQAGDNDELEYTVTESLVYWPIVLEQGLTDFLSA